MSDARHIQEESHFTKESYYTYAKEHDGETSINLVRHNDHVLMTVSTELFDFGVSSKASVVLSETEIYDIIDWLNMYLEDERMKNRGF